MAIIPAERIAKCILQIRGHKVILDSDLAGFLRCRNRGIGKGCKA